MSLLVNSIKQLLSSSKFVATCNKLMLVTAGTRFYDSYNYYYKSQHAC